MRLLLAAPLLVLACGHALRSSQTACCSWLPCCAGTNEGSGRLSHNEIRYCLPQTGLSSTMGDLITAPAAHVEARSQNAGLVTTRTISTRRDDAHRTSPTLTPSAGASSELASRHSHLPVGRALEEQLLLPPAARGIASFAAVCDEYSGCPRSNYCVRSAPIGCLQQRASAASLPPRVHNGRLLVSSESHSRPTEPVRSAVRCSGHTRCAQGATTAVRSAPASRMRA